MGDRGKLRAMIEGAAHRWVWQEVPAHAPEGWTEVERRVDGVAWVARDGLCVIASGAREEDSRRWLHLSWSRRDRLPSYRDMVRVQRTFIGEDRYAYTVLPPRARHINIQPNTLHMWCCVDAPHGAVLPDFARGGKSI